MQWCPLVPILHVYLVSLALFVVARLGVVSAYVELLDQVLQPLLVRVAGGEVQNGHSSLVATCPVDLQGKGVKE